MAICLQLNKVDALPYKTVIDVLTGLTNCSIPDFVKLFHFLLQYTKAKALGTDTHGGNMLEQIKTILSKAVDAYHSLCTAGKWCVSNKSRRYFILVCWSWKKKGYSVNMCPQPKDQKKITPNMKKFQSKSKTVNEPIVEAVGRKSC